MTFRHTFASHLVMAGVDLTTVKELLGHKELKMTLRYSHLAPAHKKNAVQVMSQILGKKINYTKTIQFWFLIKMPTLSKPLILLNGAEGSRTPDLLNAIQALSQLSYSPD